MATTYHIIGSNDEAYGISQYLWEAVRPLALRDPSDVTNALLTVVQHPTTGEQAIVLDDSLQSQSLRVDAATTDELVDQRTQALEDAGVLTGQEKAALRAQLKENRGQVVQTLDLLPARYKTGPRQKSRAEMEGDGWFPSDI